MNEKVKDSCLAPAGKGLVNMNDMRPKVSIGLPVYNGENYLREALDSILSQTFGDFEVVISDNASKDGTEEICRGYAAKDRRIKYFRNGRNIGAAKNFNLVFGLSTGEYFKWAAHDDLLGREFLQRCVQVLDTDPSIGLCYSQVLKIDPSGNVVGTYEDDNEIRVDSASPHERFHDLIHIPHYCIAVFGVVRAEVLKHTQLIGSYVGSDRCLLAEIGLRGKICRVPEYLFSRRDHPESSIGKIRLPRERMGWFDPDKAGKPSLLNWRYAFEYAKSVRRVHLPRRERLSCYLHIARWTIKKRRMFYSDLRDAARRTLERSVMGRKLLRFRRQILGRT